MPIIGQVFDYDHLVTAGLEGIYDSAEFFDRTLSGYCQDAEGKDWLCLSSIDEGLMRVIQAWSTLTYRQREGLLALVVVLQSRETATETPLTVFI